MAHATPITADLAIQIAVLLGLIACAITAWAGRRLIADTLSMPLIVALAVVLQMHDRNWLAVIAVAFGLAAVYRVLHALKAGALR